MGREGRVGVSGSRYVAYRAAWLYVCAWIVAVSLDSPSPLVGFASTGVAAAAVVFILSVLIKPRPTRAPVGSTDALGVSYTDGP